VRVGDHFVRSLAVPVSFCRILVELGVLDTPTRLFEKGQEHVEGQRDKFDRFVSIILLAEICDIICLSLIFGHVEASAALNSSIKSVYKRLHAHITLEIRPIGIHELLLILCQLTKLLVHESEDISLFISLFRLRLLLLFTFFIFSILSGASKALLFLFFYHYRV